VVGGDAAHPGAPRSDVQLSHERVFDALAQLVHCYGSIRGFKHLTSAQKLSLKPLLTPFLREVLRKEIEQKEVMS
jgi:hypothetical protein